MKNCTYEIIYKFNDSFNFNSYLLNSNSLNITEIIFQFKSIRKNARVLKISKK